MNLNSMVISDIYEISPRGDESEEIDTLMPRLKAKIQYFPIPN